MEEVVSISRLVFGVGFTLHVGYQAWRESSMRARPDWIARLLAFANMTALRYTLAELVTQENSDVFFSHLWMFPDVVVRAHQVTQQEVELLLFRHCSEIQKDQPGGEAAKWARQIVLRSHSAANASLAWFINSTRRSLNQTPVANARHWLTRFLSAYWMESTPECERVVLIS